MSGRTGRDLRVVSYNVHSLRDDRAALTSVVRELAPDILLLQEAPRRFRWRHRCAALADSLGLVVAAGGMPGRGNLILTDLRVRVERSWSLWYPLTPGRHLRGAAFARCVVAGERFVVAGTHLATDPAERPAQARRLKHALGELPDDQPVVVAGDLNDEPTGPAWQALADGLVDTVGPPCPGPERRRRTWRPDGAGELFTYSCANPRRRIDAIFVDPRIEVVSCQVVDTPAARRASDHFPVAADLRLRAGS